MRLLSILLLCSHCLLTAATVIDDDCNDQNVFYAVDEALRSFNNAKEDGNQFTLYRITDAKIKNEDGETHHFVEYETHESSCEVKNGKLWQECSSAHAISIPSSGNISGSVNETKYQMKCSAHILFKKDLNFRRVESQNCSSPEAIHRPCFGCPQPIDEENKELLCFIQSAIERVNKDANHPFYFDLESIVNATRQVQIQWKYHIHFLIRETNCSKSEFTSKNSNECKFNIEGKSIKCIALVDVNRNGKVHYPFLKCISHLGVCINCPVVMDHKDPKILELLEKVMDRYNFNSNHSKMYHVYLVKKATKKGFQTELYEITFQIKPTNCSKSNYSISGNTCDFITASDLLTCTTKINVINNTENVYSAPYCKEEILMFESQSYIGGLSPLRFTRSINSEDNDRNDRLKLFKPVKRTEKQRQKEKNKEEKIKHKYKHQDSSEENNNAVHQDPLQASEVSSNQNIFPNTEETPSPDFAECIVDVPKCPGRVWQQ